VIICAGSAYSPSILLRSRIGPASQLGDLGIAVVSERPGVGANLQDHPAIELALRLKPGLRGPGEARYPVNCEGRYSSELADAGRGDMEFGSFNLDPSEEGGAAAGIIFVTIWQPFSQGQVMLVSQEPEVQPQIEMNMLSDERDLLRMRDGVRRLLELAAHPHLATIADDLRIDEQVAVLADLPQGADLDAWLLAKCGTIGHPAGTCRMGAVEDPHSVVDSECRVIGVEGLRVVDSSVMPTVVRANNHLSCVMVAEHVFERIKADC
jgi:5-(hydroxymethyl)furfural/furfural oxidase